MKKFLAMLLSLVMVLSLSVPVAGAEGASQTTDDIVILSTNDVHGHIDGKIGYATAGALKAKLGKEYGAVLLVDAGDFIQGTPYAALDRGETILKLMREAGYDVVTLGNHEFDYGQARCGEIIDYIKQFALCLSCNFYHVDQNGERGQPVLDPFKTFTLAGKNVAFVGITTPESITKSTPAYFQNESGKYIYDIGGGAEGKVLYADVQKAIDDARKAGADYIIGVGHLGVDPASSPYTSREVIAHTTGLTAMIDGHSHTEVNETVKDKDKNDVALIQTGIGFKNIGRLIIDGATGKVTVNELLNADSDEIKNLKIDPTTDVTKKMNDEWVKKVNDEFGGKIGHTDIVFGNHDADGNRLVRRQETNSGDFSADALYWFFDNKGKDVDVAMMNGGGVRNEAVTGDLSKLSCMKIHTFGNQACLLTVTGRQLLDALEWGARMVGGPKECGGLMQTSGVRYTVDTTVPSTVRTDDKGVWTGGPTGEYRVRDVEVFDRASKTWKALALDAKYNLAGYNYTLRNCGDGFAMFNGAAVVQDLAELDYIVLADYIKAFPKQEVKAANSPLNTKYAGFGIDYSKVTGDGRISIRTEGGNEVMEPEIPSDATEAEKKAIGTADKALRAGGVQASGLADLVSVKKQTNGDVVVDLGAGSKPVTVTASAIAAANTANGWDAAGTKVEAVIYLKAGIKDVTVNGEKTGSVVFEIKPFLSVNLVNGHDRVSIYNQAAASVNGTVTITLPMPEEFTVPEGRKLQIIHTKPDGTKYTYDAAMNGQNVTFKNPDGFSTFEVTTAAVDAAPPTGDTSGMVLWTVLLLTAAMGSAVVLKRRHE